MKRINKLLIIIMTLISLITLFTTSNYTKIDRILVHISLLPVQLIPYIINKYTKFKFPIKFRTSYIIFIFIAYFLGTILNFYDKIPLYDKVIHTISGLFTSYLAIVILNNDKGFKLSTLNKILFILSLSTLIASSWEFFEYAADIIFKSNAQKTIETGINDTMIDMLVATLGSVIYIIFNYKKIKDR